MHIIVALTAYWVVCMLFCRLLIVSSSTFRKKSFRNTIGVSNSLDPVQARGFVGPDLGPNCLQRSSADDTSRQRVNLKMKLLCDKRAFLMNLLG